MDISVTKVLKSKASDHALQSLETQNTDWIFLLERLTYTRRFVNVTLTGGKRKV